MTREEEHLPEDNKEFERQVAGLLMTLESSDRWEASQAMMALYRLHDVRAVPLLIAGLSSSDRQVQYVAAGVLGELGDRRAVLPLIDTLEHAEDELSYNVGAAAAHSLRKLGDPHAVEALVRALERPYIHQAAIQALGQIGDRRAVEPLIAAMCRTKNPSIATVLGNFRDPRAVEPFLTELAAIQMPRPSGGNERRWQDIYFYYVIRALGKLGDPRAIPLLRWIVKNETGSVLKGKSLSAIASRALERIHEQRGSGA